MKYFILFALSVLCLTNINAQEKTKKVQKIEFYANGQCGDCESRIERALDVKGIKLGTFDAETQTVTVVYKTKVINEDQIHKIISDLGYDTEKVAANQESRNELPGCCRGGKHESPEDAKDCDHN